VTLAEDDAIIETFPPGMGDGDADHGGRLELAKRWRDSNPE
jgi:hypothetical protein